jgi:transcriptional regulator with XRE-family HTH domain
MNEVDAGQPATAPAPEHAGDRLRAAREAQGLTLAEIAQRTRVPLRHLQSIEASDYAALPSPTYAVGFARAYARALGMDEVATAQAIRGELQHVVRPPEYEPYETPDPARVPSRGLAIVGLGVAIAILVLVGLWYGTDLFRGGATGGAVTTAEVPAAAPPITTTPPEATPAAATPRQVTLTAGEDEVWMRVYDANNDTLYLGTLAPGASFDVPPTANRPMINVGRPDQLIVKVDGQAVPPLGDGKRAIKDVAVDAVSIAARLSGGPQPTPSASPTASSSSDDDAPRARTAASSTPRPRPSARSALSETQRANLAAAENPPAASNTADTP